MRVTSGLVLVLVLVLAALAVGVFGDEALALTPTEALLAGVLVASAGVAVALAGQGVGAGAARSGGSPAVYIEWETPQGWEIYPSVPLLLTGADVVRQRVRMVNRGTSASGPVDAMLHSELPVEIEFEPVATDDLLTRAFISDGVKLRWRHPSGVFPGEVTPPVVLRLSKTAGSQGLRGVRQISIECRDEESTVVTRSRCEVTV